MAMAWAQVSDSYRFSADLACQDGSLVDTQTGVYDVSIWGRNVLFIKEDPRVAQGIVTLYDLGADQIPNTPDDRGIQNTFLSPATGNDYKPVIFDRYLGWVHRENATAEIQTVMFQDLGDGAIPNSPKMQEPRSLQVWLGSVGNTSSVMDIRFQAFGNDLWLSWLVMHSTAHDRTFEVYWCRPEDCKTGTISRRELPALTTDILTATWLDTWTELPNLIIDQRTDKDGHNSIRVNSTRTGTRTLNLGTSHKARGVLGPFLLTERALTSFRTEAVLTTFIPPFDGVTLFSSQPSATQSDMEPTLSSRHGVRGELLMAWARQDVANSLNPSSIYVQDVAPGSQAVKIEVHAAEQRWFIAPKVSGHAVIFTDLMGRVYWSYCGRATP